MCHNFGQKCHKMLLRYVYFLSLLLCIPFSEAEYFKSRKRFRRSHKRNDQFKEKHSYLGNYKPYEDGEKESMAHIDVASFIQNPDNSVDTDQTFDEVFENRKQAINDYADSSLINSDIDEENDKSQDYQRLETNNIPEQNIYHGQLIPRYVTRNLSPADETYIKNDINYGPLNRNIAHNKHLKKKCILKNMKIPFFSHDKSTTAKTKKNRKRKLFVSHKTKQNSNVTKVTGSNLNSKNPGRISVEQQKSFKLNKRSYFERLCPDCKKKFIHNSDWIDKCRRTANNVIHNSRQYYQNIINDANENISKSSDPEIKHNKNIESNKNNDSFDGRWERSNERIGENFE